MSQWITIKDASILVNQSVSTVRRMIKKDPTILTKLENSANGGFRMYLHKEALVTSFENSFPDQKIEEAENLSPTPTMGQASPAPVADNASAGGARDSQLGKAERNSQEVHELKIELERWKCRADEYKNRFEHELLERYRERKMFEQQNETKDALLGQLNVRLKESADVLLNEQKRAVELNERFTPRANDSVTEKSTASFSWDILMIMGSGLLLVTLIAAFIYIFT